MDSYIQGYMESPSAESAIKTGVSNAKSDSDNRCNGKNVDQNSPNKTQKGNSGEAVMQRNELQSTDANIVVKESYVGNLSELKNAYHDSCSVDANKSTIV